MSKSDDSGSLTPSNRISREILSRRCLEYDRTSEAVNGIIPRDPDGYLGVATRSASSFPRIPPWHGIHWSRRLFPRLYANIARTRILQVNTEFGLLELSFCSVDIVVMVRGSCKYCFRRVEINWNCNVKLQFLICEHVSDLRNKNTALENVEYLERDGCFSVCFTKTCDLNKNRLVRTSFSVAFVVLLYLNCFTVLLCRSLFSARHDLKIERGSRVQFRRGGERECQQCKR